MTLNKTFLINSIHKRSKLSKAHAARAVDHVFENIKKSLESGGDVMIRGFGKFCVKDKGERRGRNPVTGNDLILDGRRIVVFKCSPLLRKRMNRKPED